jgi:hypothetical protein
VTVWLGNGILLPGFPMVNGVMSTAGIVGGPLAVENVPCPLIVVGAMRSALIGRP